MATKIEYKGLGYSYNSKTINVTSEKPAPTPSVEKKLDELNWDIDIVLSHTCPAKYIPVEAFLPGLSQDEVDRSTEDWLDSIEDKLSYISWYCGHWHDDKELNDQFTILWFDVKEL